MVCKTWSLESERTNGMDEIVLLHFIFIPPSSGPNMHETAFLNLYSVFLLLIVFEFEDW